MKGTTREYTESQIIPPQATSEVRLQRMPSCALITKGDVSMLPRTVYDFYPDGSSASRSSSGLSWGLSGMSQPDGLTEVKPGGFPTLVAIFHLRRMIQNHNRDSAIHRIVGMSHIPKLLVGVASNLRDLIGTHT